MSSTWWRGSNELDEDQLHIISLPLDDSALIMGPPGSGKTNLLLLRANYLYLAGQHNIVVLTFTRSLREFIASGANHYEFPISKVMTCREWQNSFLHQYGMHVTPSENFEKDRKAYISKMMHLTEKLKLKNIYDAILLDEAQDYTPEEIRIFSKLTDRLICVADERQKIYNGEDSVDEIKACVGNTHTIRFHYRNGVNICRVADGIAMKWYGYRPLAETSNYDEKANPSTVDCVRCGSIEEQAALIVSRLGTQRLAFPEELIGILCPKKDTMNAIWNAIEASDHSEAAFLLHGNSNGAFSTNKNILVSTFHNAKGLEFRALHLASCEELKLFRNNRHMAFTAVTRAKTALSIYHCEDLHGYFESAINSLGPAPDLPSIEAVFGGS